MRDVNRACFHEEHQTMIGCDERIYSFATIPNAFLKSESPGFCVDIVVYDITTVSGEFIVLLSGDVVFSRAAITLSHPTRVVDSPALPVDRIQIASLIS